MPSPIVITVFGSSRPHEDHADYEEARQLGSALAVHGFTVCTGGYGGVMEAASRGVKEAEGRTLAVTAEFFQARANAWVDEEVRVGTWQERLFELLRRGDGYVACKGGTGTLVELAVAWEMINKGVSKQKPFVVLGEFWRPIVDRVRQVEIADHSNWSEAKRQLIHVAASPAQAADYLARKLAQAAPVRENV